MYRQQKNCKGFVNLNVRVTLKSHYNVQEIHKRIILQEFNRVLTRKECKVLASDWETDRQCFIDFNYLPTLYLSEAVRQMKTESSKAIRKYSDYQDINTGKSRFWDNHYYAESLPSNYKGN